MSGLRSRLNTVWQLHPLVQLHWRRWGDEWAVFDVGSGQTHQTDTLTAITLLTLESRPLGATDLRTQIADELQIEALAVLDADLLAVLERLASAGLIESS